MEWFGERLREAASACLLLTRLPVWRLRLDPPRDNAASVWAYPLAGALAGAIGALVFASAHALGIAALPAAALTLAAQLLVTGGLHEDGLADLADGFGGGQSRERKLEIMRDSRVGSYGALALVMSTLLRATAIAATERPVLWLIVAGTLSRAAMLALLATTPAARNDGLAAALRSPPRAAVLTGLAIAAGSALFLPHFLLAITVCAVVTLALRELAHRQIGGQTGDVLGACAVLNECALLTLSTIS
jgi:adenosylcobinamide-GDP ribazoletransferase